MTAPDPQRMGVKFAGKLLIGFERFTDGFDSVNDGGLVAVPNRDLRSPGDRSCRHLVCDKRRWHRASAQNARARRASTRVVP